MNSNMNDTITPNPLFMKDVFDELRSKRNRVKYAAMIEFTFEAFGLPIEIVEINFLPDSYVFLAKPKQEMEAKDIVKRHKDIALVLAVPPDSIGIKAPIPGTNTFGIYVTRINTIGQQIQEAHNSGLCKSVGSIRKKVSKWFLNRSEWFFRQAQTRYKPINDRYHRYGQYLKEFHRMNSEQLVETFNHNVGNTEQTSEHVSYIAALHQEFDKRKFDYSEITSGNSGLLFKRKIKLIGKQVVIDE